MTSPTPPLATRIEAAAEGSRELLQQIYIRVCKDSGFQLDLVRACELAARTAGTHPLAVWQAMPSLDVMSAIAAGKHPAALRAQALAEKGE